MIILLLVKKFHDLLVEFHDFSMTTVIFHEFPVLENSFLKFHDFKGCMRTLITIHYKADYYQLFSRNNKFHVIFLQATLSECT